MLLEAGASLGWGGYGSVSGKMSSLAGVGTESPLSLETQGSGHPTLGLPAQHYLLQRRCRGGMDAAERPQQGMFPNLLGEENTWSFRLQMLPPPQGKQPDKT